MHYCVVVTNSNQAKFFTLETADFPEFQPSPKLVETKKLKHPYHKNNSAVKTLKRQRDALETGNHQKIEHDKKFANSIAQAASKLTRTHNISDFVLVSQKRMLGHLRHAVNKVKGMNTQELAKDLSKLNPQALHAYLAQEKLIPKCNKPQH